MFSFSGKVGPVEVAPEVRSERPSTSDAAIEINKLLAHFNRPDNSHNAVIAFEVFSLCRKHKIECPPEILDFIAHVGEEIVVAAKNTKRRHRKGGENTKDTYASIIKAISNSIPEIGKDSVLQEYNEIIESTEELLDAEVEIEARYKEKMKKFFRSLASRNADDIDLLKIPSVMRSEYKAAVQEVLPPAENGSNRQAQIYMAWRKREGRDGLFNSMSDAWETIGQDDRGIGEIDLG